MLLINEQLFGSFADMTLNNLDGLTATTLKVRMMDKQIPILNPYYQFSQTISYQQETPQSLIQTIPGILNDYPQNQFSDIVSTKIITIPKIINASDGSFIEQINEYYYMQVIRNELTIHIGLSSTVITTKSRYAYSNVYYCVPPVLTVFTIVPLNLSLLRLSQILSITRLDCLVYDGFSCMFKTEIDLYKQVKEQISKYNSTDLLYLCGYNYTSTKFFLNTDSDDFLLYLQTIPEFGNISTLIKDHNDFKTATLYMNYTNQDKVVLKYYRVMPNYQKYHLDYNGCVMVIQNNTFIQSSTFTNLRGQQTVSPNLLYLVYQQNREIIHFARYIPSLEYLLDNPLIEAVYLGHSWISNQDRNYADLLEQQTFVENETGTNNDLKVINRVCVEMGRLYNNQYFVFSTNPKNNKIVRNEHLKSNIDGTNQKFRLSIVNGITFLTKPLLSKNKSIVGISRVGGYLTLQLKIKDIFIKYFETYSNFIIMDASGSLVYSQSTQTEQYTLGVKQLLIEFGYLLEKFSNSTVQSIHRTCSRNHDFWESAYKRSENDEFTIVLNRNISKISDFLSKTDYTKSAVYERSVIFKAESQFFLGGFITIKEFSALNEFIVLINDVQLRSPQITLEQQQQFNLSQHLKNIPQNITVLDKIYPNLIRRGKIPQKIVRFQFMHDYNVQLKFKNFIYVIIISQSLFIILIILLIKCIKLESNYNFNKQFQEYGEYVQRINRKVQANIDLNTIKLLQQPKQNYFTQSQQKYVDIIIIQLCLQKVNLIFDEKNISVVDCLRIINLLEDEHQTNLFRYIQFQPVQYYYRSFTLFVQQKLYSDFLMNQNNMTSWIPNEYANFASDLKIVQSVELTFVPSKRYISLNNKNVSKLVTRLQTAIQSTIQSRVHSKPTSRQDCIVEIQNLPFWFYNYAIDIRHNPNPCRVEIFTHVTQNQLQQSHNVELYLQCSIDLQ
ncbi:Conserved_hypothetical protein [Hexamita inflata]|uniref:Uncharacterized protein n=1 Tax=Hexamita inflata TaxID=28002 RepID=A0AA86U3X6_9EUKA|nr:Conserved hypothetical protein [Hexamita inflata]